MKNGISALSALLILIFFGFACSSPKTETPANATKRNNEDRKLNADVELTKEGLKITNRDTIDFSGLKVRLNMKNAGGDDGVAFTSPLTKGASTTISYEDFLVGSKRFNRFDTVILTVFIKSEEGYKGFLCPSPKCVAMPDQQ